jgi:hypothetical protein
MRGHHFPPRQAEPVLFHGRFRVAGLLAVIGSLAVGLLVVSCHGSTVDPPVTAAPTVTPSSHRWLRPGTSTARSAPGDGRDGGADEAAREELASRPMAQVPSQFRRPMPVSARDPGTIDLPAPTGRGAAGVPTGFPRTPAGAMAQLIAIDRTAMESGSLSGVRQVIAAWALPGGPTPQTWSGVRAMAGLLTGAGLSGAGSPSLRIVLTPAMGLIKGSVGDDFVVPCVDFEVDVTLTQTAREAVADCQRMVWTRDRWMIGPGSEPATGTSVWPDTEEAIAAGYRDLSVSGTPRGGTPLDGQAGAP